MNPPKLAGSVVELLRLVEVEMEEFKLGVVNDDKLAITLESAEDSTDVWRVEIMATELVLRRDADQETDPCSTMLPEIVDRRDSKELVSTDHITVVPTVEEPNVEYGKVAGVYRLVESFEPNGTEQVEPRAPGLVALAKE
jgi:hypothetical protein